MRCKHCISKNMPDMGDVNFCYPISGAESEKIIAYGRFTDKRFWREKTLKN